MKNKLVFIILALSLFLLMMVLYKPFDDKIENMLKTACLQTLIMPVLALLLKNRFNFFKDQGMKTFAFYMFIALASSGLGMILKCAISGKMDFVGLMNIIVSLTFLIFSSSKISANK